MLPLAISLVAVGALISAPLTALLVRMGNRLGALDSHGGAGHTKVLRSVPNIGGMAIVGAFVLPLTVGLGILQFVPGFAADALPSLAQHLPRLSTSLPTGWALLGGVVVLHILGAMDDRKSIGALRKAVVQAVLAAVLAIWFDVRLLTALDVYPLGQAASVLLTVIWVVATCNAVNFMDNMDGLAAGTASVIAALLMAATIVNEQWFIAGALGLLLGGMLGFLPFNFRRGGAKIFMGDGGSLPIGFILGVLTARTTFIDSADPDYALGSAWYGVFMPLMIMAVPLYDLVAVSLLRIREGRSPFVGDQRHLSHRLVGHGLTSRQAAIAIWALAATTGIGGIVLGSVAPWQAALLGVQTVLALALLGLVERAIEQ